MVNDNLRQPDEEPSADSKVPAKIDDTQTWGDDNWMRIASRTQTSFASLHGQYVSADAWSRVRRYFLPIVFTLFALIVGFLINIFAVQFGYDEVVIPVWEILLIGVLFGCLAIFHSILVYIGLCVLLAIAWVKLPVESLWIILGGFVFVIFNVRRVMHMAFQLGEENPLDTINYIAKGLYAAVFPVPRWLYVEPNYLSILGAVMAIAGAILMHLQSGLIYPSILFIGSLYFDTADGIVARRMKEAGHERADGSIVDTWCDNISFVAILSAAYLYLPDSTFYVVLAALFFELFKEGLPFPTQRTLGKYYLIAAIAFPAIRLWWVALLFVMGRPTPTMISSAYFYYRRRKNGEVPPYFGMKKPAYSVYFIFWLISAPISAALIAIFWNNIFHNISLTNLGTLLVITLSHWIVAGTLVSLWITTKGSNFFRARDDPWWFYKAMFRTLIIAVIWALFMYFVATFVGANYLWAAIAAILLSSRFLLKELLAAINITWKTKKVAISKIAPGLSNPIKCTVHMIPDDSRKNPIAAVDILGRVVISNELTKVLPENAFHAILEHEFSHSKHFDGLVQLIIGGSVTVGIASPLPWILQIWIGESLFTFGYSVLIAWLWLFTADRCGFAVRGLLQTLHENRADKAVKDKLAFAAARGVLMSKRKQAFGKLDRISCIGMGYPIR